MNTLTRLARGLMGQLNRARFDAGGRAVSPLEARHAEPGNQRVGELAASAAHSRSLSALCCAALSLGCASVPFGANDANLERAKNQAAYGSSIFERDCASCHGPRGEGRGAAPPIMGLGALGRYPRVDSTYMPASSTPDGQPPLRQAPAPEMGRPEFVSAQSVQTYLVYHMPKIKRGTLTDEDYWAVVSFMLLAHGIDVPADGVSRENASLVAINPR